MDSGWKTKGYPDDEENLNWQDELEEENPEFVDADDLDEDLDADESDVEEKELDWAISQEEGEDDWS